MSRIIVAEPLTRDGFAEFGDVIDTGGANHYPINGGRTERFHDLATAFDPIANARYAASFLSALRRGKEADVAIRGIFQVGLSMPVFYLGLVLLTVFGARLGWLTGVTVRR